jgi:four helix bundle protein
MVLPRAYVKAYRMGFHHLRAYQAAVLLRKEVDDLLAEIPARRREDLADLIKHLDESVNSVMNNIAEGNDSIYPGKKTQYLDLARCSGKESQSGLRSLVDRKGATPKRAFKAIGLTIVINKMLLNLDDSK